MANLTIEQLPEAHPRLTRAGVLAAIRFGVEVLCADVYVAELTPGITGEFLSEKLQELVNAHARVADQGAERADGQFPIQWNGKVDALRASPSRGDSPPAQ